MLNGIEHIYKLDPLGIAITSIARIGTKIYCGLTGGSKSLTVFDIEKNEFTETFNVFPWIDDNPQLVLRKIHNSLGALQDGNILFGEGILYNWDGIPFELKNDGNTEDMQNRRLQAELPRLNLEECGPSNMETFDLTWLKGGKILLFKPDTKNIEEIGQLPATLYSQSMVVDPVNRKAYGHTIGNCQFFEVDIDKKTIKNHGRISTWAFHNMVVKDGIVYGAWIDFDLEAKLRVLRFDPKKGFVERLNNVLLNDPGERVQGNKGIDQWLVHSSGQIYVGIAGTGILYQFNEEKLNLTEIGRVGQGGRITSLDEDENGRVIFTGGFPKMSIGRYDPESGKLEDFGPLTEKYDKIYFHGSTYYDKKLYLAETDSGVASLWEVSLP
ncbi:MAG: hypothetical protein COA79_16390 [Planctomycetota bacterium]|nr:MAG: hypothetical protein COA79_16390 [Planctomycetota bacterium]